MKAKLLRLGEPLLVGASPLLSRLLPGQAATNAEKIAAVLANAGRSEAARESLKRTASSRFATPRLRGLRALRETAAGSPPEDLRERAAEVLAASWAEQQAGRYAEAGECLHLALSLLFHPVLHFGTTPSPLLEKGSGFLTPYAGSEWAKALGSGEPRRERRGQGGTRVLFLTYGAPTFVKGLIAALEDDGEVSCRLIDLALSPAHRELVDVRRLTQARAAHLATGQGVEVPPDLREAIEKADVVFVEWGHRAALWASMITDLRARLVVRIHAYEARTALPQLIAWENVDDVIFVADHVRALVEETAPGIARAGRISTLPNAFHAAQFTLPKLPGVEHTLGLVSWNSVVKDAAWALEVLAALRETDPDWRLLLVGNTELPAAPEGYADRVRALLEDAGDSVERTGFRTDIPEVLRGVGVILSSSLSEGTHEAVAEGAASGALPVVRDWPHVASWGGARGVYPDQWVVGSISDAVARICDPTGPDGSEWVRQELDWAATGPRMTHTILGAGNE